MKDLSGVTLVDEDKSIVQNFNQDKLSSTLIEFLTTEPIQYKLAKLLKKNTDKSCLETEIAQLIENGNLTLLHTAFTNERACTIFLLMDELYNLSQLARKLATAKNSKDIRSSIRYWIDIFLKLKLISPTKYRRGNQTQYEKNVESIPVIIKLLDFVALINLRSTSMIQIKSRLPREILERTSL